MFEPLAHQLTGLEWIDRTLSKPGACGFLLADLMGLGKTILTAMYLKQSRIGKRPDLIVCPGAVTETWENEIMRIKDYPEDGPTPRICLYHGSKRAQLLASQDWDYVITTYGILTTSVEELQKRKWGRIVLDESHYIKNGGNGGKMPKRAKAAFELAPYAKIRICISGTPFNNRMGDVAAQARFIGTAPYDQASWWRVNQNRPPALKRWAEECMLRRTKEEVGLGLKPPIYHDIRITPTARETELVESLRAKAAEQFRRWRAARGLEKIELQAIILALIMKLRIVSNTFYGGEDYDKYEPDDVLRDCAKIDQLVSDIDDRLWQDPKRGVVVFSEFSNMTFDVLQYVLQDQLAGVEILRFTGKESLEEKNFVVDYFNCTRRPRVLLASTTAGGTGISLHHGSSSVFILEPYYHPFMEQQAEQRVHRVGQKEQVHVYRYIMEQSVELWMKGVKSRKADMAASLALAEEQQGGGCSFSDIAELFTDFVSFTDKPRGKAKNDKVEEDDQDKIPSKEDLMRYAQMKEERLERERNDTWSKPAKKQGKAGKMPTKRPGKRA